MDKAQPQGTRTEWSERGAQGVQRKAAAGCQETINCCALGWSSLGLHRPLLGPHMHSTQQLSYKCALAVQSQ